MILKSRELLIESNAFLFVKLDMLVQHFINRHWVAKKVHRSVQFVTDWWEKLYDQCFAD
jgi:hypothetical protein